MASRLHVCCSDWREWGDVSGNACVHASLPAPPVGLPVPGPVAAGGAGSPHAAAVDPLALPPAATVDRLALPPAAAVDPLALPPAAVVDPSTLIPQVVQAATTGEGGGGGGAGAGAVSDPAQDALQLELSHARIALREAQKTISQDERALQAARDAVADFRGKYEQLERDHASCKTAAEVQALEKRADSAEKALNSLRTQHADFEKDHANCKTDTEIEAKVSQAVKEVTDKYKDSVTKGKFETVVK